MPTVQFHLKHRLDLGPIHYFVWCLWSPVREYLAASNAPMVLRRKLSSISGTVACLTDLMGMDRDVPRPDCPLAARPLCQK
jgi:hypothetical protein